MIRGKLLVLKNIKIKLGLLAMLLAGAMAPVQAQTPAHPTSAAIGLGVAGLLAWNPMQLDGIGLEIGRDDGFRQGSMLWLWDMNDPLFQFGALTLTGHWEASIGQIGPRPPNVLIAATPVLEWRLTNPYWPYVVGGVGLSWISTTEQQDHRFSTHFQFNERLGLALDVGKLTLIAQFQHHSNGDIVLPNNGYNFYNVALKFWY